MARTPRIEYAGAVYHVTARGNARGVVFRDDRDRNAFLEIISSVSGECRWKLYGYCLMDNHYHLLLETTEANLSCGMRQINGTYTQLFNRRHDSCGHLFQGRYKAVLVEKESYLLELCRYIALNPVRAGAVKDPADWPWSSYRDLSGIESGPLVLDRDWVLSQFDAGSPGEARKAYVRFVLEGIGQPVPWEADKAGILLGSDDFIRRTREFAKSKPGVSAPARCMIRRPELEEIFRNAVDDRPARNRAVWLAWSEHRYTVSEIALYLGLNYFTVSAVIRKQKNTKKQT